MKSGRSRREFLETSLLAGASALCVDARVADAFAVAGQAAPCPDPMEGGRLLGTVPFAGADPTRPYHQLLGSGLNARRFTDLSTLTADTLVTANDRFFVRTAPPDDLVSAASWRLRIGGLVGRPSELGLADLTSHVAPRGVHLLECAGNNNPGSFGLMSAARWAGVPLAPLLDGVEARPEATRVLVSGVDPDPRGSPVPVPGASWIFTFDDLASSGAFLATEMNGAPLPREHGSPVRLFLPGWYGCVCIKWVNEIALVDDQAPATAQMREYAARTHQDGVPELAKDFRPATLDLAATPVRVEKWLLDGRLAYRVVGIVWGGTRPVDRLLIRFKASEPFVPFEVCPPARTPQTWTLWSYMWRPAAPGRYQIALRSDDSTIPTRRLDIYFYTRGVWIDEV